MAEASRRGFLGGLALGAACLGAGAGWAAAGAPAWIAAAGDADGRFHLLGLTEDGAEAFRLLLPARGHAAAAHPRRAEAVAFARRPGAFALVIDCVSGRETARLTAPPGRSFSGHGAFSADGAALFTTENDEEAGEGAVGLWSADEGYRRVGSVPSGGIGPHEIVLMPDGRRLAVANGGLLTDRASGRANLNLATMRPNLAYLAVEDGRLEAALELEPALRMNSLRHLATSPQGDVAIAMQWEGPALEAPPLLALHRAGATGLETVAAAEPLLRRMRNYAGSVAVSADGRRVALTAPRGGLMLVHDLATGAVTGLEATDICGVARRGDGFGCTTGEGRFLVAEGTEPALAALAGPLGLAFDNHLVAI